MIDTAKYHFSQFPDIVKNVRSVLNAMNSLRCSTSQILLSYTHKHTHNYFQLKHSGMTSNPYPSLFHCPEIKPCLVYFCHSFFKKFLIWQFLSSKTVSSVIKMTKRVGKRATGKSMFGDLHKGRRLNGESPVPPIRGVE